MSDSFRKAPYKKEANSLKALKRMHSSAERAKLREILETMESLDEMPDAPIEQQLVPPDPRSFRYSQVRRRIENPTKKDLSK
jgi:hypothetical protein